MTTVTMTVTTEGVEDGVIVRLISDMEQTNVETILRDTPQGFEQRTTTTDAQGHSQVIVDKVDRAMPPLHTLAESLNNTYEPLVVLSQAMMNVVRYDRLKREGKPISMQTMCMDGMHTGEEFANVPFRGGIVGVPEHTTEQGTEPVEEPVSDEFLTSIWGEDQEGEAA